MSSEVTLGFIHCDGFQIHPKLRHSGAVKVLEPTIKKNDEHVLNEVFPLCLTEVVEFVQETPHQAAVLIDKRLPRQALSRCCTLDQVPYLRFHSTRLHRRNPLQKKARDQGKKGRVKSLFTVEAQNTGKLTTRRTDHAENR